MALTQSGVSSGWATICSASTGDGRSSSTAGLASSWSSWCNQASTFSTGAAGGCAGASSTISGSQTVATGWTGASSSSSEAVNQSGKASAVGGITGAGSCSQGNSRAGGSAGATGWDGSRLSNHPGRSCPVTGAAAATTSGWEPTLLTQSGWDSVRSSGRVISSSAFAPCFIASISSHFMASSCSLELVPGPEINAESSPTGASSSAAALRAGAAAGGGVCGAGGVTGAAAATTSGWEPTLLTQSGWDSVRSSGRVISSSAFAPCFIASISSHFMASSCSLELVPGPEINAESSPTGASSSAAALRAGAAAGGGVCGAGGVTGAAAATTSGWEPTLLTQSGWDSVRSSGRVISSSAFAPCFIASISSHFMASSCSLELVPGPEINAESSVGGLVTSPTQLGASSRRSSGLVMSSSAFAPCFMASISSHFMASSCSFALVPGPLTFGESSSFIVSASTSIGFSGI